MEKILRPYGKSCAWYNRQGDIHSHLFRVIFRGITINCGCVQNFDILQSMGVAGSQAVHRGVER